MNLQSDCIRQVHDIVIEHARLGYNPVEIGPTTNLYAAGLSSLTTIRVMLALEDHFRIEFPENMLGRQTFECIQSIAEAIAQLQAA